MGAVFEFPERIIGGRAVLLQGGIHKRAVMQERLGGALIVSRCNGVQQRIFHMVSLIDQMHLSVEIGIHVISLLKKHRKSILISKNTVEFYKNQVECLWKKA